MSEIINYTCNGCGLYSSYGKTSEQLNIIEIDVSRYIAFSSGFIPSISKIKIHFCNRCYAKIKSGEMHYSTDGTFDKAVQENEKLKKKLSDLEQEFRTYKAKVSDLLRAGG